MPSELLTRRPDIGAAEASLQARDFNVAAARAASCDGSVRRLPDGYDTIVGERGARLSGDFDQAIGDGDHVFGRILHPSPASPAANRDWAGTIEKELKKIRLAI